MAKLNFITASETDFGGGIDSQSAEANIKTGFLENAINADPQPTGEIKKRTGYQGYAGNLPVRAQRIDYSSASTGNISIYFDSSVFLPHFASSPLIILGRTSSANAANVGDFPVGTDAINYYSGYVSDSRSTVPTGTNTLVYPKSIHEISTAQLFAAVTQSTSNTDQSNQIVIANSISVNSSTDDVSYSFVNSTGSSFPVYFLLIDKAFSIGTSYAGSTTVANGTSTIATGSNTYVIPQTVHQLDTTNIQIQCYSVSGATYTQFQEDQFSINLSTGDVTVTLNNLSGSTFTAFFVLSAAPIIQKVAVSVSGGATGTVTVTNSSYVNPTSFVFASAYIDTGSGTLTKVKMDSVVVDDLAGTFTVSFQNHTASAQTFDVIWEYALPKSNKLVLSGSVISSGNVFSDMAPQMTVWGLDHTEIYDSFSQREGWTNYIDSYQSVGDSRLLAGLGGNLFSAQLSSEAGNAAAYLLPTLYPSINGKVPSETVIGPVFYSAAPSPARTRGYITGTLPSAGLATVSSAIYNSGTGYVDYTLTIPGLTLSTTLSTIISTTAGLQDYLTVSQCGYSGHNGTFQIQTVTNPTATTLVVSVSIPAVASSDFDEANADGFGGIFTDQITFSSTSYFLAGDILLSDIMTLSQNIQCVSTMSSTSVINNLTSPIDLPINLHIFGQRTSYIVPLRTINFTSSVTDIVRGDMLSSSQVNQQLRVKSVNQLANVTLTSVTSTGTLATATLSSGDTTTIFAGKKLLLLGTGNYDGVQTVVGVPSLTTFTFASTQTTSSATGFLVGNTVEVDENLTYSDTLNSSSSLSVFGRWIPVEKPENTYNLTPQTVFTYFDSSSYVDQDIVRSVMVQDNMYMTNYTDEVLKFDSQHIYRAGLFRWQPGCFITTDTGASGKITLSNPTLASGNIVSIINNLFKVTLNYENTFVVGDKFVNANNGAQYTVTSITNDGTNGYIAVDNNISGSAGNLTRISIYNYYFRLNAVDANSNVIASAAAQSGDYTVTLGADAAVRLRLIGFPAWDIYDYSHLEVQIYRTKSDQAAPYYLVTTLPMSFNNTDGYIDFVDTNADSDLITLDVVTSALVGSELGTAWTNPLQAKCVTTSFNKLILGNLKDYPALDITILPANVVLANTDFTASANSRWLFLLDGTTSYTTTDMVNAVAYQFMATSASVTIAANTAIVNNSNTSFTVTSAAHGLVAGNWVYLYHSAVTSGNLLTYSGWFQIASVTVNAFTIHHIQPTGYSPVAADVDRYVTATAPMDVPVLIGTDGNFAGTNQNTTTASPRLIAMTRMGLAINASMRKTDTQITGYSTFVPWLVANSGNDYAAGELLIKQPRVIPSISAVILPALTGVFNVYVNGTLAAGASQVSTVTNLYPSRIIVSYPNYPEIFDNPTAVLDSSSTSAIDINPADGQEITGIIPFFGMGAFGPAKQSNVIVVFKESSIYLVDLSVKAAGTDNPVQRLETRGIGCKAPFSIASTRQGIMFATDTGIYKLNRSMDVDFTGRKYGRHWQTGVNLSDLSLFTGHHDTRNTSYKVSYASLNSSVNDSVAVYNHTREYEGKYELGSLTMSGLGSWATHTNMPSIGWATLDSDDYFAAMSGRVFKIRHLGENSDYRDDSGPVEMTVITRPIDGGDTGIRKLFGRIISYFRVSTRTVGTTITSSVDHVDTFSTTDAFILNPTIEDSSLIGIVTTLQKTVGLRLTLMYQNSTIDEPTELTGIAVRMAGRADQGTEQAASTQNN